MWGGGEKSVHCVKKTKCKKLPFGGGAGGKKHSVKGSCVEKKTTILMHVFHIRVPTPQSKFDRYAWG
jgi:hypothetical protein